ncbi:RagB/SusD family nutrient uptake outer membrane protein [Flavobacterium sp. PLA-1-15]|uniref:RagB/SusD family nutrient uptake outer membrane protein n=1 Tax=Flavobacterium sp. PLA-1-15 TaxID=3380533 RepID=UPI003B7604AB
MKKNIIAFLTISTLFTSISCSDDFVDRKPPYAIDSENYFNSKEDYEKALIGAYDLLHATYVNVMLGEIASDNTLAGGGSATDVVGFQQIDDMIHTPVNANLKNIWDWMFAGVGRCNYILEFKDKTDFEGKEHIIAQTRFLRAYYHFELVKWFGGIPLTGDVRFKVGDELTVPRASVEEVYAVIESDLIYAIQNLSTEAQPKGRVTVGAAQALLGKAYLYQKKYAQAATTLDLVIGSGTYDLVQNYSTIFENNNENNIESVFEVQYTDAQGASFDCLQCSEGNVAVGFNGPRTYSGPMFDSGYSFNVPTAEAYAAFENGDNRRDIAILNMVTWAAETGATYGVGHEHTGFFNRKYIPRQGDLNLGDDKLTNPNNYRSIRYADVLLMAAEAYSAGGIDDVKARLYLNTVIERAFGNTSHNVTASGPGLTDLILKERRLELVGEGHRFFDLVRTGKAAGTIPGFVAGKHELFPIPFEEIGFSNGNWAQNPQY